MSVLMYYDVPTKSGVVVSTLARQVGLMVNKSVYLCPDAMFDKAAALMKRLEEEFGGTTFTVTVDRPEELARMKALALAQFMVDSERWKEQVHLVVERTKKKLEEAQKLQSAYDVRTACNKKRQDLYAIRKKLEWAEQALLAFGWLGEVGDLVEASKKAVEAAQDFGVDIRDALT